MQTNTWAKILTYIPTTLSKNNNTPINICEELTSTLVVSFPLAIKPLWLAQNNTDSYIPPN